MSIPNVPNSVAFDPFQNAGNWNEPKPAYGKIKGKKIKPKKGKKSTVYPFNKVYESESGHVIEIDDTPGSERISQFHRSGTFEEIHPNGDKVTKVVRDNYTSVLRDDYIHIDGNRNLTVDKALKILVNADKGGNTAGISTNFDIEVGDNANINIIVNRGNCNVRLQRGDMNLLLDRGDVNIRQNAGNYNHFVNGDYNLEIAGHMHMVVGEDCVNEIGGSRDIRVDGLFDHLYVSTGYQETQVPLGNLQCIVGMNKEEIVIGELRQNIGIGKITNIYGFEEKTVGELYTLQATKVGIIGLIGVGVGTEACGVDISVKGDISIVAPAQVSITAPTVSVTALMDMDILSTGNLRIGGQYTHVNSTGPLSLTSNLEMNLLSTGTILATAPTIHLNGPPAQPAEPAQPGLAGLEIVRLDAPLPPTIPFLYTPGTIGVWRKTINGITPLVLVRTSVVTLSAQLAVLDTAANTVVGLMTESKGTVSVIKTLKFAISDSIGAAVAPITQTMTTVSVAANSVVATVNGVVANVQATVAEVTGFITGVAEGAMTELNKMIGEDGLLGQVKGALSSVAGFIGNILNELSEAVCWLVDLINTQLDALLKKIQEVLDFVINSIISVLEAVQAIIAGVMKIIQDIIKMISDVINGLLDVAGKFIDGVMDAIAGLFEGFGKGLDCGKSVANSLAIAGTIQDATQKFAKGEISVEEFEKIRSDVEANQKNKDVGTI